MALDNTQLVLMGKALAKAQPTAPVAYSYGDEKFSYTQLNEAFRNESNESELEFLRDDFVDVINEINYSLGKEMNKCFKNILGHDVCLYDVVNYFNKNLPIYFLKNSVIKRKK